MGVGRVLAKTNTRPGDEFDLDMFFLSHDPFLLNKTFIYAGAHVVAMTTDKLSLINAHLVPVYYWIMLTTQFLIKAHHINTPPSSIMSKLMFGKLISKLQLSKSPAEREGELGIIKEYIELVTQY